MDYDIAEAFARIEKELMESMVQNLEHHRAMETDEGFEWSQWQVEQIKALENYKKKNREQYGTEFRDINKELEALIYLARQQGQMSQEIKILDAIKKGFTDYHKPLKGEAATDAAFFRVNDRKVDSLIKATKDDFEKAEHAMLRRADDQYRKTIFTAQLYAAAGGVTYEKAVDMAMKDFIKAGIQCVEYKNGARHSLKDYADMCIKTAVKRAYLTGEGEKRQEWGISLVIMNKRGNPCPKCAPFVGKIMVDDVWSGGKPDGKHMLMSTAIEKGLYHPRCQDIHTTYFEGISTAEGESYTEEEQKEIEEKYNQQQKVNYCKRQEEQQERLSELSIDEDNKMLYKARKEQWTKKRVQNEKSMSGHQNDENSIIETINSKIDKEKKKRHNKKYDFPPIYLHDLPDKDAKNVLIILNNMPEPIKSIVNKYYNDIKIISFNPYGNNHYSPRERAIRVYLTELEDDIRGAYTSLFHEVGHNIDHLMGRPSHNSEFEKKLRNDFENIVNEYIKRYNYNKETIYRLIEESFDNVKYHSTADIISGITINQCCYTGREIEYWENPVKLSREAFAHFFEAFARNDIEKIIALQKMFPTAMDEFINMMR